MPDPVYPLPPDARPPSLGTYNALGTMLLYNSRPDETGCFFATQWLMIILPVAPLRRYYVREGRTTLEGSGSTTEYQICGTSRIRAVEVVRAYLFFWVLLPAALIGPILVAMDHDDDPAGDDVMLVGMFVSVGLILLLLTLLFLHRTFWRPVRTAHRADPPPRAKGVSEPPIRASGRRLPGPTPRTRALHAGAWPAHPLGANPDHRTRAGEASCPGHVRLTRRSFDVHALP